MYTNSLMSTLNARRSQFEGGNTTLAASSGVVSKIGAAGQSTMSVPTWERGYPQTRSERYTHSQVHHDIGTAPAVRVRDDSEQDYDEYELQQKSRPVEEAFQA